MKKLILAALVAMLAACSGPTDIKLSEMNQPENAKKLREALSPQDRSALEAYVRLHTMQKNIDYKMTVKEAIEARKAEVAAEQGVANAIK